MSPRPPSRYPPRPIQGSRRRSSGSGRRQSALSPGRGVLHEGSVLNALVSSYSLPLHTSLEAASSFMRTQFPYRHTSSGYASFINGPLPSTVSTTRTHLPPASSSTAQTAGMPAPGSAAPTRKASQSNIFIRPKRPSYRVEKPRQAERPISKPERTARIEAALAAEGTYSLLSLHSPWAQRTLVHCFAPDSTI